MTRLIACNMYIRFNPIGIKVIDRILFHEICNKIESEQLEKTKALAQPVQNEQVGLIALSLMSIPNALERHLKIGRFIGKNGKSLSEFRCKYNIKVNIINQRTGNKLRRKLTQVQDNDENWDPNDQTHLYVLLTKKTETSDDLVSMDEIKHKLRDLWNKTSHSHICKTRLYPTLKPFEGVTSVETTSDDRWSTKQRHNRSHKIHVHERKMLKQIKTLPQTEISSLELSKTVKKLRRANRHQK